MLLENKIKNLSRIIDVKVQKIDKICNKKNITRLSFLLNFINSIQEIDKIVVGIDSVNQLKKIIKFMQNPIKITNFKRLALTDERIVDPRSWIKKLKIAIIVQAREDSVRFPKKVLFPISKKPLILKLLERLSYSKLKDLIIVAIPKNKRNINLESALKKK